MAYYRADHRDRNRPLTLQQQLVLELLAPVHESDGRVVRPRLTFGDFRIRLGLPPTELDQNGRRVPSREAEQLYRELGVLVLNRHLTPHDVYYRGRYEKPTTRYSLVKRTGRRLRTPDELRLSLFSHS